MKYLLYSSIFLTFGFIISKAITVTGKTGYIWILIIPIALCSDSDE